ncbi:MAG TPA: response regulator [Noviherbaspirillum sp.]|nr:response regulator [Noviherbaspirillum sp.]
MQRLQSVETTLLAGFALILLVFGLLCSVVWHSAKLSAAASASVVHTHEVLNTLSEAAAAMGRASAASHSYVITGSAEQLDLRDESLRDAATAIARIHTLVADNPSQATRLARVEELVAERRKVFLDYQRIRDSQGLMPAVQVFGSGHPLAVRLQDAIEGMMDEERRLLHERKLEEEATQRSTAISLALLAAALTAVLVFLFSRITRQTRLRQAAAQALEQSEARLKQILDVLPVAVFISDADGRLSINRAGYDMFPGAAVPDQGTDPYAQFQGTRVSDGRRMQGDDWPLVRAFRKGETVRGEEIEIDSADGTRASLLVTAVPLRKAGTRITGGVAVCQDVTELKRTERGLRIAARFDETRTQALALFNAGFDRDRMFNGLLELLCTKHPFPVAALYHFDDWAGRFRLAAGWGLPAEATREFGFGEGLPGQAAQAGRTLVIEGGRARPGFSLQTGIGEHEPPSVLMVPVLIQDRCPAVLVLAASLEVSPSELAFVESLCVQLGTALSNLKLYDDTRQLAEQLRTRSEEIASKNAQLEAANRMKSEFLANMSHELRTPLNAIIGFSELLMNGVAGELSAEQREYAGDIFGSGQHLLSLINDILDLSKVEAGAMKLDLAPVNVKSLCMNSVLVVREKAQAEGIRLEVDAADDLGSIDADARKMKQIVYNLLSNAVKFTERGGTVTLAARCVDRAAAGRLSGVRSGRSFPLDNAGSDRFLEIRVIDSGIGIAPEEMGKLFEPFSQLDTGLARRFEGTGLGLTMVKRLAELHGGTVAVESEAGAGASFIVWLPYREAKPDNAAGSGRVHGPQQDGREEADAAAGPWALVVEDDERAAELIRLQLEAEGLAVVRVARAEEAIAILASRTPALITLDILLPGLDGWQFLDRIKAVPELARIPVVIISVVAESNRGLSLGAAAVFEKPVRRDDLHEAIAALGIGPTGGCRAKVLVVDDDPKAVEIIAAHLPSPGFEVVRAYGGAEAIESAHRSVPDLIVLDLMMPEVSGFDVVESLKGNPDTVHIPILIVTARHIAQDEREALSRHVTRIMQKSEFNHGRFIGEVRRALGVQARRQ